MSPTARGRRPLLVRALLLALIVVGFALVVVVVDVVPGVHAKQTVQQYHAGFVATSSLGVGFHAHAFPVAAWPATADPATSGTSGQPRFAHALYNVSIAENSVGKTYAVQPPAEDRLGVHIPVSGPDLDVKFRIVGGDKDKLFKAEDRRVGDFAFLAIRTRTGNVILNREKIEEYRLDVRATITQKTEVGGGGGASSNGVSLDTATQIAVRVLDTNDLSPMFYPNEYSVAVPEDMQLHKSILRVVAEDADMGINGEIYYSLLEPNDYFAVHPSSGVLTLTRSLKFTDRSFHDLVVVATDRGFSAQGRLSQASKAKVHVKVKQVSVELHCSRLVYFGYWRVLNDRNRRKMDGREWSDNNHTHTLIVCMCGCACNNATQCYALSNAIPIHPSNRPPRVTTGSSPERFHLDFMLSHCQWVGCQTKYVHMFDATGCATRVSGVVDDVWHISWCLWVIVCVCAVMRACVRCNGLRVRYLLYGSIFRGKFTLLYTCHSQICEYSIW